MTTLDQNSTFPTTSLNFEDVTSANLTNLADVSPPLFNMNDTDGDLLLGSCETDQDKECRLDTRDSLSLKKSALDDAVAIPQSSRIETAQVSFSMSQYLVPTSLEWSERRETEHSEQMSTSGQSQLVGALYNPFDDLSLPAGQFGSDDILGTDDEFRPAEDVVAMLNSSEIDVDQKSFAEAFPGVTAITVDANADTTESTETSRSAYFAARSSRLGMIESETTTSVDGELRPHFSDSHSIYSPQTQEPAALYRSSLQTQAAMLQSEIDELSCSNVQKPISHFNSEFSMSCFVLLHWSYG
ncbi:uncharacterized protein LOC134178730 [Corticium candelabrum]|uniref:uncharacterized protein LOC134178730 n=1 Tax=Corticium candelabrum TaxID=121492 RepID=UPI002E252698|nr:uncharacterized protein LOC134178730 [Corticium candelabrum]